MRRDLARAVGARLATVTGATGYYGQVGAANGLPLDSLNQQTPPDDPPTKSQTDLRVQPYFVFFPGGGGPGDETSLEGSQKDLDWEFTVRAVAGDVEDLLALVDTIEGVLLNWSPGLLGPVLTGRISHPVGYRGQVIPSPNVSPPRHSMSLPYLLHAYN